MTSRSACLAPLAALLLAACSGPAVSPMPGMIQNNAGGLISNNAGGLAGLVGNSSVISAEEAELRDIQRRPTAIAFPARVGVLFYEYQDPLKREDHQAAVERLAGELATTGLVASAAEIPSNLVRNGDSLDTLRKLAARFQVDVLLLVSGSHEFVPSATQAGAGLFDFGGTRRNYDARSTVTGLAIGVFSGTFLTPFQVVGKIGDQPLDPAAADFGARSYALKKQAHEAALGALKERFGAALQLAKATQDAAPPAPSPTPTPSTTALPGPDTGATASPSPTATPTASPTATPAP